MLDATTTRWALRLLGIVYPGYLTYKTLEHDRKRGENQRGWCIYWAVASAWLGCVAPVLDLVFDGRVALYGESKVRARGQFRRLARAMTIGGGRLKGNRLTDERT